MTPGWSLLNGDLVDLGALLDRQHHVKVAGVTKDGVDPIEVGLGAMAQEELGAAGVFTGMGHRQAAGLVLVAVDFAIDRVARTTGTGHPPGAFTAIGATTLGHEAIDHPMEGEAVVEARFGQFDEVGHGARSIRIKQLNFDAAGIGVHQGFGHGAEIATQTVWGRAMGWVLAGVWDGLEPR